MDRRTFVKVTTGAGAAMALGSLACARSMGASSEPAMGGTAAGSFPIANVGLQLYSVRTLMAQGVDRTLEALSAAGYTLAETAGLYNLKPAELRVMLDRHGIRTPAGHWGLALLEANPDEMFATAHTLGQEYIVIPYLDAPQRDTREKYIALADRFNRLGEKARAAGLRLAYHNHNFEFETMGGTTPMLDILMERTDPALLAFEVDTYWVNKAGVDPVAFVDRHRARIEMIHVKDSSPAPEKTMMDVGQGVIDYNTMFAHARGGPLKYAFVEHDEPAAPLASVTRSHEYLAKLLAAR
jgi:sugar phosphate isomerase/epimerase